MSFSTRIICGIVQEFPAVFRWRAVGLGPAVVTNSWVGGVHTWFVASVVAHDSVPLLFADIPAVMPTIDMYECRSVSARVVM